jgi:hypothetical protein
MAERCYLCVVHDGVRPRSGARDGRCPECGRDDCAGDPATAIGALCAECIRDADAARKEAHKSRARWRLGRG